MCTQNYSWCPDMITMNRRHMKLYNWKLCTQNYSSCPDIVTMNRHHMKLWTMRWFYWILIVRIWKQNLLIIVRHLDNLHAYIGPKIVSLYSYCGLLSIYNFPFFLGGVNILVIHATINVACANHLGRRTMVLIYLP